ncbi:hypothetical protein EON65_57930, partial [archaeon]
MVTILKLNVSNNLKAAAVRLLMCLHVDRDPQASSRIPCLTRRWSDVKTQSEPQLPYVEQGREFVFGLIQLLISEYIKEMYGTQWDELSQHMLRMLRTLVMFNFYGNKDRMNDIIAPLIKLIDRRSTGPNLELADNSSIRAATLAKTSQEESSVVSGDLAKLPGVKVLMDGSADGHNEDRQHTDQIEDYLNGDDSSVNKDHTVLGRFLKCVSSICFKFYSLNQCAARSIALIDEQDDENKQDTYVIPLRYSKAPIFELETMVEAVDILAFAQRVIEDRNVSILLRYFYSWESGQDKRSPGELFEKAIEDSKTLSLDTADFDRVMIDALMYVHAPLVQSTLEVLMAHHSKRKILLDNIQNLQLLASPKRERQYTTVRQMLQQLEQNAETHELWGELESEADQAQNKQTKDILKELTDICR